MEHIKKYSRYIQYIKENLSVWYDSALKKINAEKLNIFKEFNLPYESFNDKLDLEFLDNNIIFINSLSSVGLKKSEIKYTEDFETFVDRPAKFMLIYDVNSNELENPKYILFQFWDDIDKKWSETELYEINDDIKKFYDALTTKTVEILDDGKNYIYNTSNGNEWVLQNIQDKTDKWEEVIRKEEFKEMLKDKNLEIKII